MDSSDTAFADICINIDISSTNEVKGDGFETSENVKEVQQNEDISYMQLSDPQSSQNMCQDVSSQGSTESSHNEYAGHFSALKKNKKYSQRMRRQRTTSNGQKYHITHSRNCGNTECCSYDYDQEMHKYDTFCYEYYCKLRQNNAALYQELYENWYFMNNYYPECYDWSRNSSIDVMSSDSWRSPSQHTLSGKGRTRHTDGPRYRGPICTKQPDIDFSYYDAYFYGFYDTMRRINPTMYAILYAKWCASHHLAVNETYRSRMFQRKPADKSSCIERGHIMSDYCDSDGKNTVATASSAILEDKEQGSLRMTHSQTDKQLTSVSGERKKNNFSPVDVNHNGGVMECGSTVVFHEQEGIKPLQETKMIPSERLSTYITTDQQRAAFNESPTTKEGESWISMLLTKLRFSNGKEAHLPDDDCPTIIWDNEKKQWIDATADKNDEPKTLSLPPKSTEIASTSTETNIYRLRKSRALRYKYVDILQTSSHPSNTITDFSGISRDNALVYNEDPAKKFQAKFIILK